MNFDDHEFTVTLSREEKIKHKATDADLSLKAPFFYRHINRISYSHPDSKKYIRVDLSIVKETATTTEKSFKESKIYLNDPKYEIEVECLSMADVEEADGNAEEADAEADANADAQVTKVHQYFQKTIKLILCGLQQSLYPMSLPQQKAIIAEYLTLCNKEDKADYFIGFNTVGLELKNVQEPSNAVTPNIRAIDYTVTDKADGDRKLLFINKTGKAYFITRKLLSNNVYRLHVQDTNCISTHEKVVNCILDGEHILSKDNTTIFAIFDVYYFNNKDVRALSLCPHNDGNENRIYYMEFVVSALASSTIIKFQCKQFEISTKERSIFQCAKTIIDKYTGDILPYNIDGLIFTPAYYGVLQEGSATGSTGTGSTGTGSTGTGSTASTGTNNWYHCLKWKFKDTFDFQVQFTSSDDDRFKKLKLYCVRGKNQPMYHFKEGNGGICLLPTSFAGCVTVYINNSTREIINNGNIAEIELKSIKNINEFKNYLN